MKLLTYVTTLSLLYFASLMGANPTNPVWPSNVKVYPAGTSSSTIQTDMDNAYAINGNGNGPQTGWNDNGQFSANHYAFLFAPGTYTNLDVKVGYYTSVLGLGMTPSDTTIDVISCYMGNNGTANTVCPASYGSPHNLLTGSLNTFWRSAENFTTNADENVWFPTQCPGMTWAASQASPLRKINVLGALYLFQLTSNYESGFSSGGFMADCTVTGTLEKCPNADKPANAVVSGSQQQYFVRNTKISVPSGAPSSVTAWSNSVWNQVFVGCDGAPPSACGNCIGAGGWQVPPGGQASCVNCDGCLSSCTATCTASPYTTIAATPRIAEKPYIVCNSAANAFSLVIPPVELNKVGTSEQNPVVPEIVSFANVYVANPSTDTAATINAAIAQNYHVVLCPGTYQLTDTIEVSKPGIVVLGIGFPILISETGKPCMIVKAQNVRVAGVLWQAGPSTNPVTPTLLQWGTTASDAEGGFLYDCFARTGRFSGSASEPFNSTDLMVHIVSNNVVGDNFWLWRADHDSQGLVYNGDNGCNTAIVIDGDDVITYGLASEHTLKDMTIWNGNNGRCYFYQAELPYDAPLDYNLNTVGYRVGPRVTSHQAWGVGVYSFFRDNNLTVKQGIGVDAPSSGITFVNSLTRYLAGYGGIASVLNGLGANTFLTTAGVSVSQPGPAYLCEYSGANGQPRTVGRKRYSGQ